MEQPKNLEDGVVINTKDFGKSKPCVGLSPTLLATDYKEPKLVLEVRPVVIDYSRYRVRKLTPTEYGRLQGFHMDSWVQAVSNSQAYKQFGNAVTTTVAKGIATNIIAFLDGALGGGELGS